MESVAQILMVVLAWFRLAVELDYQQKHGTSPEERMRLEAEVTALENDVLAACRVPEPDGVDTAPAVPAEAREVVAGLMHDAADAIAAGNLKTVKTLIATRLA